MSLFHAVCTSKFIMTLKKNEALNFDFHFKLLMEKCKVLNLGCNPNRNCNSGLLRVEYINTICKRSAQEVGMLSVINSYERYCLRSPTLKYDGVEPSIPNIYFICLHFTSHWKSHSVIPKLKTCCTKMYTLTLAPSRSRHLTSSYSLCITFLCFSGNVAANSQRIKYILSKS